MSIEKEMIRPVHDASTISLIVERLERVKEKHRANSLALFFITHSRGPKAARRDSVQLQMQEFS